MDIIGTSDTMPFDEKDKFWAMLFNKISTAISIGNDSTTAFALSEISAKDIKDDAGEEYTLIVESDQYEIFLNNYIQWSEKLERYEECTKAIDLLALFQKNESTKE